MIRRTLAAVLMVAFSFGVVAVLAPAPAVAANCVACPAILIDCGPCGVHHPDTCKTCQYCTPKPNCTV